MANPPYYEELSESVQVAVIADKDFGLDEDSAADGVGRQGNHRQLLIGPVVYLPNAPQRLHAVKARQLSGQERDSNPEENRTVAGRPFTCVGVRALAVDPSMPSPSTR